MGIQDRASARFAALRRQALDDLVAGRVAPGPHPPLDGWCISTVVRIVTDAPALVEPLQHLQRRLDQVGQWRHYEPSSMHVSLLGCTQREEVRQGDQHDRLAAIERVVAAVVPGIGPVAVGLGRLGLLGPQAYVEVVPVDERWAEVRRRLGDELSAIGETPMTHPDAEPIHLNVSRLDGAYDASALATLLSDEHASLMSTIELATIEFVVTDFALTPANTTFVTSFRA